MPFSTGFGTKDDKVKRILFGAAILFSALLFFTAADGLAFHAGEEGTVYMSLALADFEYKGDKEKKDKGDKKEKKGKKSK